MKKLALPLLVSVVAVACSAHVAAPRAPDRPYPGSLIPVAEIPGDFLMRQRVTARYPGRELSFDAALQKQGDTLTLLGLTPFGTRAFLLQQRGTDVTFTAYMPGDAPFPPRYMLLDIHRTFFIGLGRPPTTDGERRGTRDGEEITERWENGRLMERHFRRLDDQPPGTVDVRFVDGMQGHAPPRTIEFRNGWYGYALTITTIAHQTLAAPARQEQSPPPGA